MNEPKKQILKRYRADPLELNKKFFKKNKFINEIKTFLTI